MFHTYMQIQDKDQLFKQKFYINLEVIADSQGEIELTMLYHYKKARFVPAPL